MEAHYRSQFGQDRWLHSNYFQNRDGVFVDVGAHDGVVYSNSYFFEKALGWTGICVEPNPEVFKSLKQNRTCVTVEGCAYNRGGTVDFMMLNAGNSPVPGLEYVNMLSGICGEYTAQHRQRVDQEIASAQGSQTVLQVPCFRLETLLEENGITKVDYLSLDTEGSEIAVLEGLNFDKVRPKIIDVETNSYEEEQIMKSFLNDKGYQFLDKIGDCIFIDRSSA